MATDYVNSLSHAARGWKNVGSRERMVCMGIGAGLALAGLWTTGRARRALTMTGASIALRGAAGWCPIYASTGVNRAADGGTREALSGAQGVNVEESIQIRRNAAEIYDYWRRLENLPHLMDHLESVVQTTPIRSHWVARGPLGMKVEWDAEIINEIPGRLLAWRSLKGADLVSAGSVQFHEVPLGTDVRVRLQYAPPAGKAGAAVAWLLGETPAQELREGLARLGETIALSD